MQQITVRVPASTSNLGPGFDCLGVALRIYNSVTIVRGASREHPHPEIVSETANRFFKQAHRRAFSFCCSIAEQIPRSRGLGSSATIRLGVLLALNRLSGNKLDRLTIFRLCAELEGHPDNAAPAIFGGFTVVASARSADPRKLATGRVRPTGGLSGQRGVPTVQRFPVSQRLHFVLFVPNLEIRTSRARNVLPSKIPHTAAVENCANACALTAAFVSQDYQKLRGVFADHLHQPFRAKLIPFLPRMVAAAEKAGALGAFLSGSGSTIAAVTLHSSKKIGAAMTRAAKTPGRTITTHADNRGACLIRNPKLKWAAGLNN
jgi:homoserine kinase